MSLVAMKAPPLSRNDLKRIASDLRRICHVTKPYFPVDYVLEVAHVFLPGYSVTIEPVAAMGDNHGLTLYADKIIKIREDVYIGACEGKGRDRMTCAHELSHAFLHTDKLASARDFSSVERYEDPEWQAMALAGHLLIPDEVARGMNIEKIVSTCGVSRDAAQFAVSLVQFCSKK